MIKPSYVIWLLLALIVSCQSDVDHGDANDSKFVGTESCIECHEEEYADWKGSHHDLAMMVADSTTILADFNDVVFTSNDIKSTFFKKGDDYFVNTQGADSTYQDYKIEYTFGVTPLQQYIVEFPNGHYQCLQTAWDVIENKWFDLQPDLDIGTDEWIHWTGGGMKWNTACADCHSTDLHKNYNSEQDSYNTTFDEINVNCEACHGPASAHVSYYENPDENVKPPLLEMDTSSTSMEFVDKCARCHSRRSQFTEAYDYKGSFMDHYKPELLVPPIYELDGQIKDEDYVYGSFIQSKMYHNKISCKNCHDVHSATLMITGNTLCMTCHVPKYNEYEHHFHEKDSEGAQCINCHMTGKIYMGNDFRRDHSFRVPRPDQTVEYGTPNACNGCHEDKTPEWASEFVQSKYGTERVDHFSDHMLAGFHGDKAAFYALMSNWGYPDLARATALRQYANQAATMEDVNGILPFLKDSSVLVRNEAILAIDNLKIKELSKNIEPLLLDSVRMVRISAARYFNTVSVIAKDTAGFRKAQQEHLNEMELNSDFASGQHQVALYEQNKGNVEAAISAYRKAIEKDSYYNFAKINLAMILYEKGDVKGAEQLYLKVTEQEPDFGYSFYMLGLLYHETGDTEKALQYLSYACDKEPLNLKAFYNYALKLQEAGKNEASIKVMERALKFDPNNVGLLYVKLIGEMNSDQNKAARSTCARLLEIAPNNTDYQQIHKRLNQSK